MNRKFQSRMDRLMFRVIPSCRRAMELQSRSMDERLPVRQRVALAMHCALCRFCRRYGRQLRWIRKKLREFSSSAEGDQWTPMESGMRERLRRRIREEKE